MNMKRLVGVIIAKEKALHSNYLNFSQRYIKDNCVLTPHAFAPYLVNIFLKVVFNERVARQDQHIFEKSVIAQICI